MSDLSSRLTGLSRSDLRQLLNRLKDKAGAPARIVPIARGADAYPLSPAQERLWFLDRLEQAGRAAYNISAAMRLTGALSVEALHGSLQAVVDRHEALRTVFGWDGERPVQRIASRIDVRLPLLDLSGLEGAQREVSIREIGRWMASIPFDLENGPPARFAMARLTGREHILWLTVHHIVADGWSMNLLSQELASLYEALHHGRRPQLPAPTIQYVDYVDWQQRRLAGDWIEEHLAYWRERLIPQSTPLELPGPRPRTNSGQGRSGQVAATLPADLTLALRALSRREETTLFVVLLAAFKALLSRYTGRLDLAVGAPVANRNQIDLERVFGLLLNTLMLRTDLSGDPGFKALVQRVHGTVSGAYAHQDLPFEMLLERLQIERDRSRTPLFQVLFNFLSLSGVQSGAVAVGDLTISPLPAAEPQARFDLTIYVAEEGDRLQLEIVYRSDLFDAVQIEALLAHYRAILSAVVEAPDVRLSDLPLALPERGRALAAHPGRSIVSVFEEMVRQGPDRLAVQTDEDRWSYRTLDAEASRIARHLVVRRGAAPERIGLLFEPGAPMVAAILGVLKAGKTYVPLDSSHPRERLAAIAEDARVGAVLCERGLCSLAGDLVPPGVEILDPEALGDDLVADLPQVPPETLAYILYTSGSTGRPKGVFQNHRNVVAQIDCYIRALSLHAEDRLSLLASYSFDAAVMDLFGSLLSGASLHPWPLKTRGFAGLERWLAEVKITVYHSTPSVFRYLTDHLERGLAFEEVRLVVLGGEEARSSDQERCRRCFPRAVLVNGLGPTESTLALQAFFPPDRQVMRTSLPVGAPVEHSEVELQNAAGRQVALYGIGEILLSSPCLAVGYWQRPDLTAAAFVPDPRREGGRTYRTGDLGRWLPGGMLEYIGRRDDQVKIRGVRVELGEVEAALLRDPRISEAVVLAHEVEPGEVRLAAYVVSQAAEELALDDLRAALGRSLPEPMIPAAFQVLPAFPRNANGKLDRRALPAPDWGRSEESADEGATLSPTEELVQGIWCTVLHRNAVGVEDDFFALGGHSLLATRVAARVRETFGIELPLRLLFELPTVRSLARSIDEARLSAAGSDLPPPVPRRPPGADLPASFAQQRLWLLDKLAAGLSPYNLSAAVLLEGPLDVDLLERVLAEVVRRHEALRTTFVEARGLPVQVVREAAAFPCERRDLRGAGADEVSRHIEAFAGERLDLSAGPLFRVAVLRLREETSALVLTMHHIISDGWSIGILLREITLLYEAWQNGRPSPLDDLPVQYGDFALWQREWLRGEVLERQMSYWRERLDGLPPALELPTDRPRPPQSTFRGARCVTRWGHDLLDGLGTLSRRRGVTLFMVLLAAWETLLGRLTGQEDLATGTPVANRERSELEGLIGLFINMLVLRGDLSGEPAFRELLARVRAAALGAYAHQSLPFEQLVERLEPERDLSRTPLFQVVLVLQNTPMPALEFGGLRLTPLEIQGTTSRFDLMLSAVERDVGLEGTWEYNSDLYDRSTILRWAGNLETLLQGVLEDPERRIWDLPLLSSAESDQLIREWNAGEEAVTAGLLHELFEAGAAAHPEREALIWGERRITYGELERRSRRVAERLRASGVGPEVRVGLCVGRSAGLVIGALGILRAGGVYVPLDPDYPPERLGFMLRDSAARRLILERRWQELLPETAGERIFLDGEGLLDPAEPHPGGGRETDTGPAVPENLAYVIYTSGSTGRPKGVAIRHASAVALLHWARGVFSAEELSGALASTSICFDLSVFELFVPLSWGGRVILAENALELPGLPARAEVSLVNTVPSAMADLARREALPASVRTVNLAGEELTRKLADEVYRTGRVERVLNLYGPSEDTTYSTWSLVPRDDAGRPTIGRAIAGTRAYVLDRHLHPVPVGVVGELYLGGDGLARGYLNRPELTAERFVPDGWSGGAGERLYRTGDLARWLPDGSLDLLGRSDHQVKVRGFRIELGEIETALSGLEGIAEAVVMVWGEGASRRLVAYVVPEQGADLAPDRWRELLHRSLPQYMIPSDLVQLERLPRTPNGKLDRRLLPDPKLSPVQSRPEIIAPRTSVERELAAIWSELLELPRVSVEDQFFKVGGHSLVASQIASRIRELYDVEVPLSLFLENPSIADLDRYITDRMLESIDRDELQNLLQS